MDYCGAEEFVIDQLEHKLPEKYFFHNPSHTVDVIKYSQIIAKEEKLSSGDMLLVKTAALFHDTGYMFTYKGHEKAGVDFAHRHLPAFDYTANEINIISNMIIATCYPQKPQSRLDQVMCDADLFYMTTGKISEKAINLRMEMEQQNIVFSNLEWYEFEIEFLENHKFFTLYAQNLYAEILPNLIRNLENKIKTEME